MIIFSSDEPSKPNNLEVTDWDLDMVEMAWTPPEKDGGSPISGYQIEYKDKFSKEWSKGAVSEIDCNFLY